MRPSPSVSKRATYSIAMRQLLKQSQRNFRFLVMKKSRYTCKRGERERREREEREREKERERERGREGERRGERESESIFF